MIAKVIIDRSSNGIDKTFDYYIPDNLIVQKGDRLLVPFGKQNIGAFCLDIVEQSDFETKSIIRVIEQKCLSDEMLQLLEYMRKRFFLKYIDTIRLFVPSAVRKKQTNIGLERKYIYLNPKFTRQEILEGLSLRAKKQIEVIKNIKEDGEFFNELSEKYGAESINSLIEKGYLIKSNKAVDRVPFSSINGLKKEYNLTSDQEKALETIFNTNKETILLHGVTGSGKTAVYIEAIKKVLNEGKSAIILVPEISLTPQMLNNFRGVFGDKVAMIHSGLNEGERFDEWQKIKQEKAKIVVGARSGIFAPISNIGLIVIDEEHDTSYTSESNPRYRVLEIAQFRAHYNNAKVVLGSATPSIETYQKAQQGEYELIKMPNRISKKGMPQISIVDMKNEILCGNNSLFSRELIFNLNKTINEGNQAMLLINRLGYSSFVRCSKCGYVPKCEHCDVTLSYHKAEGKLVCHYCGTKYKMINQCPSCRNTSLIFGKMGTERVVSELQKVIPNVKTLRLDSDTKAHKDQTVKILDDFSNNKAQVLVGTQMIAKGHDFPNVTLVGLVDADLGLYQQDFRSNERTFQLVTQMSGRAGRGDKEGKVILQTYSPTNYVYKFAIEYDYENFFKREENIRQLTQFPPFVSIVRILVVSDKREKARDVARVVYTKIADYKKSDKEEKIISLAGNEAPINMIKDNHRYQIIMRIKKETEMSTLNDLYEIIENIGKEKASIFVEQDPQSLM